MWRSSCAPSGPTTCRHCERHQVKGSLLVGGDACRNGVYICPLGTSASCGKELHAPVGFGVFFITYEFQFGPARPLFSPSEAMWI